MAKKSTVTYTEEQKQLALEKVPELGIHKAAKAAGIPWQTVRKWAKDAGVTSNAAAGGAAGKVEEAIEKVGEAKDAAAEKIEEAKEKAGEVREKLEEARDAAVPTEIEVKKAARKAGRKVKETADKAVDKVKRTAKKAKTASLTIVIQSPMGGNITTEEIAEKVPADADAVFVRVDQNKLWWTRGEEKGDVDIW